jgi:hypothetical protein
MYRNIVEEVGKSIEKEIEITDTRLKGLKKLIYDLYMSLFPRDKANISMYLLENRFKAKLLLNMMLDK